MMTKIMIGDPLTDDILPESLYTQLRCKTCKAETRTLFDGECNGCSFKPCIVCHSRHTELMDNLCGNCNLTFRKILLSRWSEEEHKKTKWDGQQWISVQCKSTLRDKWRTLGLNND